MMLNTLCSNCHLLVVEQMDLTASLYCRSVSGDQVCLLVKSEPTQVSLEAKSSSQSLLQALLSDIQTVFST